MIESMNLNIIPNGVTPVCHVSQYDVSRTIRINLFEGISPYVIQSGDRFFINVRKPDNTVVVMTVNATQGNNYVDIVTDQQMTACVGEALCQLKITNDTKNIGTLNFIMLVERDVLADGIASQSVIQDLDAQIESKFQAVIEPYTDNLAKGVKYELTFTSGDGLLTARDLTLPAGTYTLYLNTTSDNPNINYVCVRFLRVASYAAANIITSVFPNKNENLGYTFTVDETIKAIYILAGTSLSASRGYTVTLNSFNLYRDYYIDTTGVYDMTNVITNILTDKGACRLPAGDFKIKNIEMPDYTALFGSGEKTRLYFNDSLSGIAVNMGSKCVVKDLQIYGAESDIQLPSTSDPVTDLLVGATWEDFDGFKRAIDIDLPAGTYTIDLNATSDNSDTNNLWFKVVKTTNYSSDNVIFSTTTTKGESKIIFTVTEPIKSIYIFAASSVSGSSGYTITVTSAALYWDKIGGRHALGWVNSNNVAGMVANCFIERFNGSGILLRDQGTPIYKGLIISGCYISNCNCGIYIQRNSEFNKIANSVISNNYFGVVNRGGNNNISNCNIDGNSIGVEVNQDEGSNAGHGAITNCSINHSDSNTGYGLIVRDTGRMLVSNTNFYYSKILLKNTNGNVISGCGFGNSSAWEIDGGSCSLFIGCMVINSTQTPITITNNTKVQILNCFTRAGDVVNWQ